MLLEGAVPMDSVPAELSPFIVEWPLVLVLPWKDSVPVRSKMKL